MLRIRASVQDSVSAVTSFLHRPSIISTGIVALATAVGFASGRVLQPTNIGMLYLATESPIERSGHVGGPHALEHVQHGVRRPRASVTSAPMSSLSVHEHVHTLWHATNVCCCLVSKKNPTKYRVQVCVDQKPFLEERVSDPDEATRVAEKFWARYTDAQKHTGETLI